MRVKTKHLLSIGSLEPEEIHGLLDRAAELKAGWAEGYRPKSLADKTVALVFEKPSTRTRVSFDVGIAQMGGHCVFMASKDSQMARSEPLKDTARVMGRYVQGLVVRTFGQEVVEELAEYAGIPVINALTDRFHPCQVLSDLLTVKEKKGDVLKPVYCWLGDGNNMAHSWLQAAGRLGFTLRLACPEGFLPDPGLIKTAQDRGAVVHVTGDPKEAVEGADVVSTDVWASMGQEDQAGPRRTAFEGYTLDKELLSRAAPGAVVLHCLPAHRGEEISEEVMEGSQSVVWDQAENRLHMQKAVLEALVGKI